MGCNIGLSTIFILSSVIVIFGGHFRDRVCDRLLPNNRVSTQDYLNHIATLERFLIIYSRKLNPSRFSEYGKAKRQFEANGDYNVLVSGYFRDDPDECYDLGVSEFNVTEVIEVRKTGKCRKVDKYYRMGGDDQRIKTRFISQDLSKYFWFFECKEDIGDVSDVSSYEACTGSSVLELHIKDTRVPPTLGTDLNLNMFPWGLAIQDLKDFTGLTFSDLEYKWLGKGQFVSDLVGNPEDRFSHDAAQMIMMGSPFVKKCVKSVTILDYSLMNLLPSPWKQTAL